MKKLFLFLIVFLSFIVSNAQVSFTFLGGLHGATVSPDYLTNADTVRKTLKNKPKIELGVMVNFDFQNNFSIRTGILFSAKGSDWTQYYDTTNLISRSLSAPSGKKNILYSANTLLTTNYIDMPLNLVYGLPLQKKTRFIIGAGPMLSFIYSCHTNFNTLSFSYDPTEDLVKRHIVEKFIDLPVGKLPGRVRVFHLGWNALAGFDFGKLSLTANYSKDIKEFFEENGRNYKHETFGITLGLNIEATGINNNY